MRTGNPSSPAATPSSFEDSDGRQVSLPLGGMSAGFVWYNADIFAEAGAEVPTDYDSWVDACEKITAIGKTCFTMGAGGEDTFPTEMYHSIANSVDPDYFIAASTGKAKWDDPEGVEVLQIIQDMQDDGIIAANALDGPQYPLANEAFMQGRRRDGADGLLVHPVRGCRVVQGLDGGRRREQPRVLRPAAGRRSRTSQARATGLSRSARSTTASRSTPNRRTSPRRRRS